MRNHVVPLGYSLIVASFMLTQIPLARAACANTTDWISESIQTYSPNYTPTSNLGGREFMTELDFMSCPSSSNVSCTLPPKTYTVDVTPRFTISINDDGNQTRKGVDALIHASHALDLPTDSPDGKAITAFADEHWQVGDGFHLVVSPFTLTLTTNNISHYANLTVPPGYNMTLSYIQFVTATWVRYALCENRSLDATLIGAMMPYYVQPPYTTINHTELAGQFIVDQKFLNDSVSDTEGSGVGLKARNGWAKALIVSGVLAFSWL